MIGCTSTESTAMSIQFSALLPARAKTMGPLQTHSLELADARSSPVMVFDDFQVDGRPFGPHPHAGFSAVTYVLPSSPSRLRNRDSLGGHVVVRPGGITWLQAGSGVQHEEIPADEGKTLHGLQIFVNLSAKNKVVAPATFALQPDEIREWTSTSGERARVVVGSFGGVTSSLVPAEPFTLLDVALQRSFDFELDEGRNLVVYVRAGAVTVRADGREQPVASRTALAISGTGRVRLSSQSPAQVILMSGPDLRERVVAHGPFIMTDQTQIQAAIERYRKGQMGQLEPYAGA